MRPPDAPGPGCDRAGRLLAVPAGASPATTAAGAARLADLATSDWVVPHADLTCADMVMRACAAAGFQPNVVAEATDHSVQLRLAAAGIGVALVPRLAALPTPGLRLLPVHPRVQRLHFALVRSSATSDSGIRRIVELLDEHAARLLADSALPAG